MIKKCTDLLTRICLESKIINEEEKELFRYGIYHTGIAILYMAVFLILGILTDNLIPLFLYLGAFIVLRTNAGGYHMKSRMNCYLTSFIAVFLTNLLLLQMRYWDYHQFSGILLFLSYAIILCMAPVDTANKQLDDLEMRIYRKRTYIILHIELFAYVFFIYFGLHIIAAAFFLSVLQSAFLVLVGKLTNTRIC